ncbi:hypothetical protein GFV14_00047 [Candidatus Hartigia pinicola]|nr:hypothetical protein GFV14_00047 [Candidatus Hartigia pinicola]
MTICEKELRYYTRSIVNIEYSLHTHTKTKTKNKQKDTLILCILNKKYFVDVKYTRKNNNYTMKIFRSCILSPHILLMETRDTLTYLLNAVVLIYYKILLYYKNSNKYR